MLSGSRPEICSNRPPTVDGDNGTDSGDDVAPGGQQWKERTEAGPEQGVVYKGRQDA
jgi:hypothetical protein